MAASSIAQLCVALSLAVVTLALNTPVKRGVSPNQEECTRTFTRRLIDDDSCVIAAVTLTRTLSELDIVSSLDSVTTADFATYCLPTCGRRILTAWDACGVTQNHGLQIDLINSLCGHTDGFDCHSNVSRIFNFVDDVLTCSNELGPGNQCSSRCETLLENENDVIGCCANVAINYRAANGEPGLADVVDSTLDSCSERRRDECTDIITADNNFISDLVDINQTLTADDILCIDGQLDIRGSNIDPTCHDAANSLIVHINSPSLITSLSADHSALSDFCTPSCGEEIRSAWTTCGAFRTLRAEVDFLSRLCDIHEGTPCYSVFNELEVVVDNSVYCATRSDGSTCPIACSNVFQNIVRDYGCCIDVFIDYLGAVVELEPNEPTILERNMQIYGMCGAQVPPQCTETTLNATMSQPTCPTSSSGTIIPTLGVIITAVFLSYF